MTSSKLEWVFNWIMSKHSSLLANSLDQMSNEYTNCPKCGRQYPKNTTATRQQYFCSSCGSDLKQNDIQPLLPKTNDTSKEDNSAKYIGYTVATLLLITTIIVVYFTIINPASSNDPDNSELTTNTTAPSMSPTVSTLSPTVDPTFEPTGMTMNPTPYPTDNPTSNPSEMPTNDPTLFPTVEPTQIPTINPTKFPSDDPTLSPTNDPTLEPTNNPSQSPTNDPTIEPTQDPTTDPTADPTISPTENPTGMPTMEPTSAPTVTDNEELVIGLSAGAAGIVLIGVIIFGVWYLRGRGNHGKKHAMEGKGASDKDDGVSKDYTEILDEENESENNDETTSQIVMA